MEQEQGALAVGVKRERGDRSGGEGESAILL